MENSIFTSEDALVLLSSILGNRPIKVFEGQPLNVEKNDVILHRVDANTMNLYNVKKAGNLLSIDDTEKLIKIQLGAVKNLSGPNSEYNLPVWEYKGHNIYVRDIRGWKRVLLVRHDFTFIVTIDELRRTNKLSSGNNHPTIYPKAGTREAPLWIFEDAINFNQTNAHLYISRV